MPAELGFALRNQVCFQHVLLLSTGASTLRPVLWVSLSLPRVPSQMREWLFCQMPGVLVLPTEGEATARGRGGEVVVTGADLDAGWLRWEFLLCIAHGLRA